MATTENTKILNKDYLAEQLYNYHTKYITEGIEKNKQDKIYIDSKHLTWADNRLGINIDDSEAKANDYIVLEDVDNGSLSWKTPITNQAELANSVSLVTGNAVFSFEGSTNINTLGDITSGTWNAGDIALSNHNLTVNGNGKITVGSFVIEKNSSGNLQIKYADNSYLTLDTSGKLTTKSIDTENISSTNISSTNISATNIDVSSNGNITAGEASVSDLNVDDIIAINQFEIKQSGNELQIKYVDTEGNTNSCLAINSSGNLNTTQVTATKISTTSFILNNEVCEFATIDDFNIDLIE